MPSWVTHELAESIKASQAEFPYLTPYSAAWAWLGKHLPPWLTPEQREKAIWVYENAKRESE